MTPRLSDPVNILLVDDQPAKLLSYEVILGQLGEVLITAGSAREAFDRLLRHDIAVVLIDVQMPELDGFELAAMIREHPRFQQTPLIFVSAIHLSDFDRLKGYAAGAVDYVPVPVVPELLRAKVRVFADLHRKTRELERLNLDLEKRIDERTAALEASAAALQTLNDELEVRIEKKSHEREQALAQLFEAQKLDTIGQLTGGVAHDFNNLLMAVLGSLQILKKRVGHDPAALRLVDNAMKGAERGASLTQRLLAFARRQELRPQAVAVPELVIGIRDLLARAIGPSVRLIEDLDTELPPVLIDANQLELALLNLVVNARDAMPDGGAVTIAARLSTADHGESPPGLRQGAYVRLSVEDTGMGMDDTLMARATEPFFTTKGVGKGTGLGLSMVQGLAAQSGGALKLSSIAGEGARVDLWIPLAATGADRAKTVAALVSDVPVSPPLTVLVVDDDPLVCAGTVAMLEDLGHTCLEASSGLMALAMLRDGSSVDMVITDQAMPEMTGVELARQLRASWPDLPIVLATGYAELTTVPGSDIELPRLSKPFMQDDLARMIAQQAADVGAEARTPVAAAR